MTEQQDFIQSKAEFKKKLISIAFPVALQNLMLALVGASDALMLGRLSQDAVSAVSLANQISFIMSLFIMAVIGGTGALMAQYYGKGDMQTVKKLMSVSIRLCFVISVIFFLVSFFFPAQLMRIYTPETELIKIGSGYLRIVSVSFLFSGLSQSYLMTMKITGRASKSAVVSVVTVMIDMSADVFLIYGLGGIPKLGVAGCAISTVIVEVSALIFCVAESYANKHIHPDRKSFLSHEKVLYKDLVRISLPMLAASLTWGIGYSMNSLIMGNLGNDAIAAAAIVTVIQELVTCFCKGLSSGASIMTGELLGQNRLEDARQCGAKMYRIAVFCGILNIILLFIVGPIAGMFFILTEQAKAYLWQMIAVMGLYLFAYSLNTVVACGVFQAGGDTLYDAISVALSMWCFSLPLGLLGVFVFHWPVMVVYVAIMANEVIKIPWLYPRYKKYKWLNNMTKDNI